jgi:hypothetical protein
MKRNIFIGVQVLLLVLLVSAASAAPMSSISTAPAVVNTPKGVTEVGGSAPSSPTGSGFTYQGQLNTGSGPANGQYDFQFLLFDALTGGTQVGTTQTSTNVTVANGLFTLQIDFGVIFNGQARWLEIGVRPFNTGSYVTLTPRQPITATPLAQSLMPGAIVNESRATAMFSIVNTGSGTGIVGSSTGGYGLMGVSTSSEGVNGESTSGQGIHGRSSNPAYDGVWGENTTNGVGVGGSATTTGTGVFGLSSTGKGVMGAGGTGVFGTSSSGVGVEGMSTSSYAVYGVISSNSSAVYGYNNGTLAGEGVRGQSMSGDGVHGRSDNVNKSGVWGENSTNGYGVSGSTGGTGKAFYGVNTNASGWAGYFDGNVHTTGNLTKAYTAGTSNLAAPIAYASVNQGGTLNRATPNVTCAFDGANIKYLCTIAGETYTDQYVTIVTVNENNPYFATSVANTGQLEIRLYTTSGSLTQKRFHFVTYKP